MIKAGVYDLEPIADGVVRVFYHGHRVCLLYSSNPKQYVEQNQDSFLSKEQRDWYDKIKKFIKGA